MMTSAIINGVSANPPLKAIFYFSSHGAARDANTEREVGSLRHSRKRGCSEFEVSALAVFKWVAAFSEGGQNSLVAKDGAGRQPKVSAAKMQWVVDTVGDYTPDELKFEFGLWTLRMIGQLIERQFNMILSLPELGKLKDRLGFTPQRPVLRGCEQDAALVQRWRLEALPSL